MVYLDTPRVRCLSVKDVWLKSKAVKSLIDLSIFFGYENDELQRVLCHDDDYVYIGT